MRDAARESRGRGAPAAAPPPASLRHGGIPGRGPAPAPAARAPLAGALCRRPDGRRLAALVAGEIRGGLLPCVRGARGALQADPETEEAIEEAFARVRSAFERWVEVTAADTMAAALEQRLEEIDAGDGGGAEAGPDEGGG